MTQKLAAFIAVQGALAFKIGVISDPHYNKFYNPNASIDDNCIATVSDPDGYAPIGRYECDASPQIFDLMLERFQKTFGEVDLLLIPGDHVAHKVSAKTDDPDGTAYAAVKQNLADTWAYFSEYFPKTISLPTIGNNDGRYHNQAIDEDDKDNYYSFLYDLWFKNSPQNANLDLAQIQTDLMTAGYYRADITDVLTVLQVNSMYVTTDDTTTHDGEKADTVDWLESQLALCQETGRKVIILFHEYAGGRWKNEQIWEHDWNSRYFQALETYHETVIIEVGGHDHFADLRYHSSYHVADLPDTDTKYYFHNLFVAPGVTAYAGANPGVAMFELDDELVPQNLRVEYLNLGDSFGKQTYTYDEAKWFHLDWRSYFGVQELTPDRLHDFYTQLKDQNEEWTVDYLVAKLGFNPADPDQYNRGIAVLEGKDLITNTAHHPYEYLCLMNSSSCDTDYSDCTSKAKAELEMFLQ